MKTAKNTYYIANLVNGTKKVTKKEYELEKKIVKELGYEFTETKSVGVYGDTRHIIKD